MSARHNIRIYVPYLVCSVEGVLHGVYVVWLTQHKGLSPLTVALLMAAGEVALLALEVPTGVFADKAGARASLILGSLFQALGLALLWAANGALGLGLSCLLIALGDAFRHGADEALLYRSCAALGIAHSFGARVARAQAITLVVLVALTAGGGWLVERAGFDLAFLIEVALSVVGLGLALSMVDVAATSSAEVDENDGKGPLAALRSGLPWARILPAAIVLTLAVAGQFLLQSESRGRLSTGALGLLIAAAQLLEAAGAALVARGLVPIEPWALDRVAQLTLAGLVLAAVWPLALVPAFVFVFLGAGIAPAMRSALLQREAPDEARATIASAAGAVDKLGTASGLPLCALAWNHAGHGGTVVLRMVVAIVILGWAMKSAVALSRRSR